MNTLLSAIVTSLLIALASVPSIIRLARLADLYDEPDERKLHKIRVPLLGGLSIFAATVFSFTIWAAPYFLPEHLFIIASLIILFFLGLRDDMLPLAPAVKIAGQTVAALLVVLFSDIRIFGLHGFFGVHVLSSWASIFISMLVLLYVINSFNLIDGIDGLAAGLGIIASASFAFLFFRSGDRLMTLLAMALCGSLIGFIRYNFPPARIFMGDSGTMTVGFLLAVFAIRFLEDSRTGSLTSTFDYQQAPVIVLSILIIPAVDTLRVFVLRILRGRSPFSADRNHIHYKLLELGFRPAVATAMLCLFNMLFIVLAWLLRSLPPSSIFYGLTGLALLMTQLPQLILHARRPNQIA